MAGTKASISATFALSKKLSVDTMSRPEEIRESDIGTRAGLFEVQKIGDEFYTFIVDCKDPKACTILLRGASKDVLNEVLPSVVSGRTFLKSQMQAMAVGSDRRTLMQFGVLDVCSMGLPWEPALPLRMAVLLSECQHSSVAHNKKQQGCNLLTVRMPSH